MTEFHHISVLLDECMEGLNIKPDGIYVDGTLGGAGHSSEIVKRLTTGRLIGIDRDAVALTAAGERLRPYADRVTLVHSNFCEIAQVLKDLKINGVDGILLDLGVSSPQLDDGSRGFSYMADAPLDMRMNGEDTLTAHDVVNTWSQEELKRILYDYGEERFAPQIAAAICRRRAEKPIETTLELVDVIRGAMPASALRVRQPETGRAAGREHLPLSGGSDCETRHGGRGQRLHLPAQFSGMRLWEKAAGEAGYPQAHYRVGRGADTKPQSQKRQTAHL